MKKVWLLSIVIGLAIAISTLGSQILPVQNRNPAFAGVAVEELPFVVDIEPENLNVDENIQNEVFISLYNPRDFDVTKNLTLRYKCANWTSSTNNWTSFSGYTCLVSMPDVTVHPNNTVKLKVPFIFPVPTSGEDENATENKALCQFKLQTLLLYLTVSSSPTTINRTLAENSTITARTSDSNPDVTVSFSTDLTGGSLLPTSSCTTNSTGACSRIFNSTASGLANITASAGCYVSGTTAVTVVS